MLEATAQTPLDEIATHVLLVLADGELHGYAIAKQIEHRGGPALYPANLYRHLNGLASRGLIEAMPARLGDDGRARKAFRLTSAGRAAIRARGEQLRDLVRAMEARHLLSPDGSIE